MSHSAAGDSLIQDTSQTTFKEPNTSAFEVEREHDAASPLHRKHGSTDGAFLSLLILAFFWWASTLIRVHWLTGLPSPSHDFLGRACGQKPFASQHYLYVPLNAEAIALRSVESLDMTSPVCISKCPTLRQELEQLALSDTDPLISELYPESISKTLVYKAQPFGDFLCLPTDPHAAGEVVKELNLSSTKVKLWLLTEQLSSRSNFLTWFGVVVSVFAAMVLIYFTLQTSVAGMCVVTAGPALMGVLLSTLHSVSFKTAEPFALKILGMRSAISVLNICLLLTTCSMGFALLFYFSRLRLSTVTLNVSLDVVKALPSIVVIPSMCALCVGVIALSALMAWAPLAVSADQVPVPPSRLLSPVQVGPWRRLQEEPYPVNTSLPPHIPSALDHPNSQSLIEAAVAVDGHQDQDPRAQWPHQIRGDEGSEKKLKVDPLDIPSMELASADEPDKANLIEDDLHVGPAVAPGGLEIKAIDDGMFERQYHDVPQLFPKFNPVESVAPMQDDNSKASIDPEEWVAAREPGEAPIPPLDVHDAVGNESPFQQDRLRHQPDVIVDTLQRPSPSDPERVQDVPKMPDILVDEPLGSGSERNWEALPLSRRVDFRMSWDSVFRAVCFVTSALFLIEAVLALNQFLIAAWCCVWYFSVPTLGGRRDLNYADLRTATSRVFSLHLGSVALVAALNIVLRFIKTPIFLLSLCPPLVRGKKQFVQNHPRVSSLLNAFSVSMEAVSESTISECLLQGTDLITAAQSVVDRHPKDKSITRLLKFSGTLSSIGVLWSAVPVAGITTFMLVQSLPSFKDPYSPLFINAPHLMALAAMSVTQYVLCAFTVAVSQITETIVSCYRLERQDISNSRICTPDQLNVTASEIQAAAARMLIEEGESDTEGASSFLLSTSLDEQSAPYMAMRPPEPPQMGKPVPEEVPTAATIDGAAQPSMGNSNGFLIRSPWGESSEIHPVPPADEDLIAELKQMSADGGLRIT